MKSLYCCTLLFFSCFIATSAPESFVVLQNSTQLVHDVQAFLNSFQVAKAHKESREDFLKRVQNNQNFTQVVYAISSSLSLTQDTKLKIDKSEKKHHFLGLFTSNTYAVKECGFWGGDEDGFYVNSSTNIIGKGLARFKEKGNYEWIIQLPHGVVGDEFQNTPIQPLINSIIQQNESRIIIPLNSYSSVSFTKEATQIVGRLQYKIS